MVPVATVRATLLACESPSSGAPAAADPSICNADCRQRVDRKWPALINAIQQRCGAVEPRRRSRHHPYEQWPAQPRGRSPLTSYLDNSQNASMPLFKHFN
jgi:hypothetical protein